MSSLVRPLFSGPIDIVGDLHGDVEALERLLSHLHYDAQGIHPHGRRLVFVGDLVDRGPDSVSMVRRIRTFVEQGVAQCVLGNHELNLMLGKRKANNGWFFGHKDGGLVVVKDKAVRDELLAFFQSLPLALVREDARIVHACWQPDMIDMATTANDTIEFYEFHAFGTRLGLAQRADLKPWQREMRLQNLNPVKVLTSGLEVQAKSSVEIDGKKRLLERYPWWQDYEDAEFCFFGHYSLPFRIPRDASRAICVDYGLSKRWVGSKKQFPHDEYRLGAYRYPEHFVVFDNGQLVEQHVHAT